jgi:thiamine-monophosphate kinase
LAVNLSDLAAMAARPTAAFVSIAFPIAEGMDAAAEFYEGLFELAKRFDVVIAGGDTNRWSGALVVNIALLGNPTGRGPVMRSGGCVGDQLLVTGSVGGSRLGTHLDFDPRVEEAIWIHEHEELHAAIDVSDGLSLDLSRMAEESGCGAEIELAAIPVSRAANTLSKTDGLSALEHALSDGEDFELLLALPKEAAERLARTQPLNVRLTRIGQLVKEQGLWQIDAAGQRSRLTPSGYLH